MTVEKAHHHRSSLKQRNKPFKGTSRSQSRGGRIEGKKAGHANKNRHELNKQERRNKERMLQQAKRTELLRERRTYAGPEGMPRIVAVIPVTEGVDGDRVLPFPGLISTSPRMARFYSEQSRQNLHFLWCSRETTDRLSWSMQVLEIAQRADCVLIVASSDSEDMDQTGRDAMAVLRGIGVSSSVAIVQGLDGHRKPEQMRSKWLSLLQTSLSTLTKVYCADSMFKTGEERQVVELERQLSQQHLHGLSWRDVRPYLLIDESSYDDSKGLLRVTGFMRGGRPFAADRLIHLPILAQTFKIDRIEACPSRRVGEKKDATMDVDVVVERRNEETAESLDTENVTTSDPFASLTLMDDVFENDVNGDNGDDIEDEEMKDSREIKLVPKGTSSYQAVWLDDQAAAAVDPAEELVELYNDDEEEDDFKDGEDPTSSRHDDTDEYMNVDDHQEKLMEHKMQFTERHFPDEIELDPLQSARMRLARYRGVQSLRTSLWDVNENLPAEYGRIFRFANYKHSRKVVLEEPYLGPFHVGQRVSIFLRDVGGEEAQRIASSPLPPIAFGLLRHEQRTTVLNFTLTRNKTYTEDILNKEEFVALIGYRRFRINPILSEHSTANLHKMLRVVEGDAHSIFVGTVFAPVTFTPAPVLLFHPETGSLVAVGSVNDPDPNRIILKRITLTASPFRVHKRSVVARFMFGNPEDIAWFKPVELTTRLGARGHIRESLGTHGYMKCLFDRVVFHHDTIAMHLYKRVFPKWTTVAIY